MATLDIPQELLEKARDCKSVEVVLQLARKSNLEITEEQIDGIAGGSWDCDERTCDDKVCSTKRNCHMVI